MLLAKENVEHEIYKRSFCFGAAVAVGGASFAGAAGASTIFATAGAAVSANLALASTVLTTVGSMASAQGQAGQARFNSQVATNNSIVAKQQADRAVEQAKIDEEDYRRNASRVLAQRFASGGASGVIRSEGSSLLVSEDFAGQSELNALRIRNQGAVNVTAFEQQVLNQQGQAGLFANQAVSAGNTAFTRAGSTLLKGAGTIANIHRGIQ
jgi:hypothetical protein